MLEPSAVSNRKGETNGTSCEPNRPNTRREKMHSSEYAKLAKLHTIDGTRSCIICTKQDLASLYKESFKPKLSWTQLDSGFQVAALCGSESLEVTDINGIPPRSIRKSVLRWTLLESSGNQAAFAFFGEETDTSKGRPFSNGDSV